jgi:hypothetical protein
MADLLHRICRGLLHRSDKLYTSDLRAARELHASLPTSTLASSSATMILYSFKQQGDIALKAHVASICFKCFRCFSGMLQVFHADVAKVDRDVAHVAIVVHVCCKLLFAPFHLFFFPNVRCKCVYLDVAYVLHICCKCFIYMLHMFYNGFQMFFMIFCKCFIYLQTYVAVAACGYFKSKSGVASYSSLSSASPQCLLLFPTPARHPPPLPSFSMLVMFKAARAPCGRAKQHENGCRRRHLDVPSAQTLASPLLQSYFASLESQHH